MQACLFHAHVDAYFSMKTKTAQTGVGQYYAGLRVFPTARLRSFVIQSVNKVGREDVEERWAGFQGVQKPQSHLLEQPDLAFLDLLGYENNV